MTTNKIIKECRLCSSKELKTLYDFGKIPLGNNLLLTFDESITVKLYPLKVVRCQNCNHFQLSYSVSPDLLYATNYTYLSGIGSSFINHLRNYTDWVTKKCNLAKGSFVLEIGSNDGSCLEQFKKKGMIVCGVDPAQVPSKIANKKGIKTINSFFNIKAIRNIKKCIGSPSVITSQNALAHIDDLKNTFINAYNFLKDDGFFVFEVGYFKTVLEKKIFDTIYHEHLDYHHAFPLVKYLNNLGFSIKNISLNNSQGGSIRFLLQKSKRAIISNQVKSFLNNEKKSILYSKKYLDNWIIQIRKNFDKISKIIHKIKKQKIPIVGYGAPTKATLLLKTANLNYKDINFIVDDNNLKIGKYLPLHGIKIYPTEKLKKYEKVFIILLAWNFSVDIIKKLKKLNIRIIVLVPHPKLEVLNL